MSTTIAHRYITSLQTRGGVGKSTLFSALGQYCDQRGVPWRGYDLDPDHRNFSRLFPDSVAMRELGPEPESEIIKLARTASETSVTLTDPRAHLGDVTARAWEMIRFPETFATLGGRITVLLFPGDDLEILTDIDGVVSRLGAGVDYAIVRNPARQPRTRMFDGSDLEADLLRLGAESLEIPPLLALARNHLAALEAQQGCGITHVEAVANRTLPLDGMVRLVVEDWLRTIFRRFDSIAGQLLPTEFAAKIAPVDKPTVAAAPVKRGAKINSNNL
ncbi:MAG: ATPase [Opitutae bacterium]|nr:ATPase [Opitutae bacterium]